MTKVCIDTPRGVTLVGTFTLPDGVLPLDDGSDPTSTGAGAASSGPDGLAGSRGGLAAPNSASRDVDQGGAPAPSQGGAPAPSLAATFTGPALGSPAGSVDRDVPPREEGVVLLAHDFLTDRHGAGGRLDRVSQSYQRAGLATLSIDFSGLGESDDDVITLSNEAEDLRAASGWLAERGYTRQAIHANGFGATAALVARPEHVRTAVLVGAVVGPQSVLWEQVFSPDQLDELSRHGLTRLVDDNPNSRKWNVLSKETLADFSMQEPHTTMAELPWPVLMIYGALTHEMPDTVTDAQKGFPLLKDGSQLVQVHKDHPEDAQEEVARLGTEWVARRLR